MKLAEALIQRADTQRRIEQLRNRLVQNAQVQEGETPAEDPQELLQEANQVVDELTALIKQINRTNANVAFDDNWTLTDALAERDMLMKRRSLLTSVINEARPQMRYGRMEIKLYSTVDIAALQKEVDALSQRYRELDTRIQELNWTIELTEA